MKYFCSKACTLLVFFSLFFVACLHSVSTQEAEDWFQNGNWRENLTLTPDSSINVMEFYRQYHEHQKWWDTAFAFLNRSDLATMAEDKYDLAGDSVFATVYSFIPKDFKDSKWEAHRRYADIQYMISGVEKIGKASASALEEKTPYDTTKDIAFYTGKGKFHIAKPGTFFIFFPGDAHRPDVKVHPSDTLKVKKVTIKVRSGT